MHGVCPSLPYDDAHTRPTRRWVATRCPSCSTAAFRCAATASSRHEYLYTARCVRPAELGAGGRGASDRLAVPHRHAAGPRPRCTGQRAAAKALRPDRIPRCRNRCAAAGRAWQRRRARPGHAFAGALAKTRHPADRDVALRAPAKCFSPPPDDGRPPPAAYPPVRFLLLLSCGRLDARGAFTGGAVARTCSRLAVASVCPREGRCDGPGGLSGDCDGRGFFGCVMVVSRLLSRGTARGYDGLEISDSACAAGSICERSTAKSPSATMPIKRLSRSTTGRRLTWRSLISLAAFSTESSS